PPRPADPQTHSLAIHPSARESDPVDRRYRGFRHLDVVARHGKHIARWNCEPPLDHLFQIAAGAECLLARARQYRDTQPRIALETVPRGKQARADFLAQGVTRLRAIQRDDRNSVLTWIKQYSVAHQKPLRRMS